MLPSRGLRQSRPLLALSKAVIQKPSSRALSQQFGTALRGKTETASRRTNRPLVLAAATQPLVAPFRQARYASTQPAAALPAAASAAASDAPANAAALADVTATPVSLTGSDLLDIPEQIGFLKTLGLDYGWGPTSLMQMLLESTYVYTGLPWWASIAIVAVGIRAVLAKPTLDASENAQKLQQLLRDPRYNEAKTAMMASWAGGNHMAAVDARVRLQRMNREVGYKGWKSLAPLIQLPLGIGMFRLLSGMAALPVPSFEKGGFLWLTDLTVADPYFILPIMTGLVLTSSLRINLPYMPAQQQKVMKIMAVVMPPISTAVSVFLPAGTQFYFFVTTALHYFQTFLTHQNWFRRWFGLTPLPVPVKSGQVGAATWEAPRVLDVQAPRVKVQQPNGPKAESLYQTFTSTVDIAKEKMNSYVDKKSGKRNDAVAQEYEERRALEEKEKLIARLQGKKRARDDGSQ